MDNEIENLRYDIEATLEDESVIELEITLKNGKNIKVPRDNCDPVTNIFIGLDPKGHSVKFNIRQIDKVKPIHDNALRYKY
jgi:hypothetical protein